MKNLIISTICLFPLIACAGGTLQSSCHSKNFVYKENAKIVGLLSNKDSIINTKKVIGGAEIQFSSSERPVGYLINDDNYYLYSLVKSAFAINATVNVCISDMNITEPFGTLYGIEMKSTSK